MIKRFRKEKAGKDGWSRWVTPVMDGYLMRCCGCGLVHEMQFAALRQLGPDEGKGWPAERVENGRVEFRARRWDEGMSTKTIKGYRIKNGKIEKVKGYSLDASAKIRQRKSKKITVKRKLPT